MLQELSQFIIDTNDPKKLREKAIQLRRIGRRNTEHGIFLKAASMMKQKAQKLERENA